VVEIREFSFALSLGDSKLFEKSSEVLQILSLGDSKLFEKSSEVLQSQR